METEPYLGILKHLILVTSTTFKYKPEFQSFCCLFCWSLELYLCVFGCFSKAAQTKWHFLYLLQTFKRLPALLSRHGLTAAVADCVLSEGHLLPAADPKHSCCVVSLSFLRLHLWLRHFMSTCWVDLRASLFTAPRKHDLFYDLVLVPDFVILFFSMRFDCWCCLQIINISQ